MRWAGYLDRILKGDPTRLAYSNQKAISGEPNVTALVPTSQAVPQIWQYTTTANTASTNWYAAIFDDSGWNSGLGGFGTDDPGVTPNTVWNTVGYIWLRRAFNPGNLTPQEISNLVFSVYHDEDVVIYINGVLAAQDSGYTTSYITLGMSPQAQAAIIPNATNVIAVSCHQTTGGQFIDVGIEADIITANTLTVPEDYAGYWNLDETNGTVAADSSGNGNNGTVSGASWSPPGKVKGCLSFNGANDYVQVNRDVSNDFTIAMWVRTTAIGGIGTWRDGEGLVDGSVGPGQDDFGTALVGNQFAFGTGTPDMNLVSSTPINDGAWHYCVATRVQSTGAMRIYVDGNMQASGTGTTNSLTASAYLRFGGVQSGGGFLNGNLDEIKIYNRALGNLEITALYEDTASPLAAPSNLTCLAGNGQATLNWWEVPVASSYNVGRSFFNVGPYTVIANVTTPGYTDSNVMNGTTYYYVVSSVDSAGAGPDSSAVAALPSTLEAWFAADGITGLANGAKVSNWPDMSGEGNNATQAAASQQPTFVTGAMNGSPVVRFISTNGTWLGFNRPVQNDFTIMIVYQSSQINQGAGTQFYQGAGLVNGDQPGVQNDFGIALNATGQLIGGTGNPDTSIHSGNGYNDGKPHLMTFTRTQSTGLLALYVDGTEVATGSAGTETLAAPPTLDLGAVPSGGGYLSGDIAEVRVWNSVLPIAMRQSMETALRVKYLGLVPPVLSVAPGNNGITFAWPAIPGFNLYTTTNLTPPIAWSLASDSPTYTNGTNALALSATNTASFFKLIDQ